MSNNRKGDNMVYELKTVKVNLNGSKGFGPFKKTDYAVFYQEILHGTQKAVNIMTRQHLTYPDGKPPTLVIEGEGKMKLEGGKTIDVDLSAVDWTAVYDGMILGQVKEWSFGSVNQETLDGLPENVRKGLVNEVDRLYGKQGPLPKGGGGN